MDNNYGAGIVRVSTNKQYQEGDSPEEQKEQIQRTADSNNIIIKKWFIFHQSAAGEVQPSQQAINYCKDSKNKIKYLLIKNIERFTRGGAGPYIQLKAQLVRFGVDLIDVYGVIGRQRINTLEHLGMKFDWSEYSPTSTSEILEAERAYKDRRDILTKLIGAEIRYTQLGFPMRGNVPGYTYVKQDTDHGRRYIPEPHSTEAKWFEKMFELRYRGNLTDEQIVNEVNLLGFKSRAQSLHDKDNGMKVIGTRGGNPLTVKQLQRYIARPIYAGVICEKWTNNDPVRGMFKGLVSIEVFNKANRGKVAIIEEDGILRIIYNREKEWLYRKTKDNPDYAYKQWVSCPVCNRPLMGSAPRSKSGRHIARYHCSRSHKYWSINKATFDETIKQFVQAVRFSKKFIKRFEEVFLNEWEGRENRLVDDTITIGQEIIRIDMEIKSLKEKIKIMNSPAAIRMIEDDIDKLLLKKAGLIENRDIKEEEQVDVQTLINYCKHFMEHLEKLLLRGSDQQKNAVLFSLIFDKTPTYYDLVSGTPQLSCLFELNEQYKTSKSPNVGAQGLEWNTLCDQLLLIQNTFNEIGLQVPFQV